MADEAVVVVPADQSHKRKLDDLPEPEIKEQSGDGTGQSEPDAKPDAEDGGADDDAAAAAKESDAKRPRLDGVPASENGHEEEKKVDEPTAEASFEPEQGPATETDKQDVVKAADVQVPLDGDEKQNDEQAEASVEEKAPEDVAPQEGVETQTTSRKMEVPNNKVGVLIGKAGDTIRYLQYNSGAKIQITRDAEADPRAATRPVELIGTLESIIKAEKLIKDVIAEADAGGSPSLVARGFSTVQGSGAGEQIEIQVPNEKVGLIIGKGGETIKNLQTRSGARIQLIPQHLPEGDQSKERTVRVTGDRRQIEMAGEMIKEVMNQSVRPSPLSGGYHQQQGFRPRGPPTPQWGPRGPHPAQFTGYDYQQKVPYSSQNPQYPPPAYGNYAPQQGPRSNFGPGWDHRPPATMQAPPPQAYNYGQPQGPDYAHPGPYPQPNSQNYGHGYTEVKYDSQASGHPYGGHSVSQPAAYPQGGAHSGFGPDQYAKPPSYGMTPHAPHAQSYGQPRPNQPGEVPYQAPVPSGQAYGPNVPPQQPYPYGSSAVMQQTYPPYGSAPTADGYSHPAPAAAAPGPAYAQQGGPPVPVYGQGQPGGQQQAPYVQAAPAGAYGSYPTQAGYTEQPSANNTSYGYQASADPSYGSTTAAAAYAAPTPGQAGYAQAAPATAQAPVPAQPGYDQSVPQSGGYASVPAAAAYGKSVSPQPGYAQYDSSQMQQSQMYAAHR